MNSDCIFVISERENFEFYSALPRLEQRIKYHLLDECGEYVCQWNPRLLLIDCGLDVRKGFSLLSKIKANCPEIMAILITGNGSEDTAVKAFRLGARDYFKKPFDLSELRSSIEKLLKIRVHSAEKRLHHATAALDDKPKNNLPAGCDLPANLLRAIGYLESHFADPLSIDCLAKEAGVSRFHFCRVFKKSLKMTPVSYVVQMRVERAKALLRKNLPISSVSYQSGFSDLSNFNRHFKRHTGLTPSAYRETLNS